MIHDILKKDRDFLGVCFLMVAFGIWNSGSDSITSFSDFFGGVYTLPILAVILLGTIIIKKVKEEEHYIQAGLFAWFDNLVIPLILLYSAHYFKKDPTFAILYAFISWMTTFDDSTGNLSTTKIMIASIVLTPPVVWGLLYYNNKHFKEKVEKYLERVQRAITEGGYIEAINEANEAIGVCSKNEKEKYQLARCYYWRGKAYGLAGEYKKAIQDLEKAFDLGTGTGAAFLASIGEELKNVRKLEQREDDIVNYLENEAVTTMKPKKKRKGRRMAHQDNKEQGIIKSCENCGAPMNEGAKFCSNCGNAVVAINSEESALEKTTEAPVNIEKAKEELSKPRELENNQSEEK